MAKFMRKERLAETALCRPARQVVDGAFGVGEADLGDGLFKKRLARPGGGKRGGYRVVVAYHHPKANRVLIAYAFAKNAASTLTTQGHEALARVGTAFAEAADAQIAQLLASQDVSEVKCNGD